jgi:hypothetical protein
MQTGSSGILIGWKSGQTTFVPLWDWMEGAWLRTQISSQWESQKNRFALNYFGKIQFLPPCIWNLQRRYDMNGRFQMQGGKNWILPKEMNANRFFWDSHWLEIWSNHLFPSKGPNGGSVAMDSVLVVPPLYINVTNSPIHLVNHSL